VMGSFGPKKRKTCEVDELVDETDLIGFGQCILFNDGISY